MVGADGKLRRVSAAEHPELFWAMRGAGANFGVVAAAELRLHPEPASVLGGMLLFGGAAAADLARYAWQVLEHGSEQFWPQFVFGTGPAGEATVMFVPGHTGPDALAQSELAHCARWPGRSPTTPAACRTAT